jgi:hypothetical protein
MQLERAPNKGPLAQTDPTPAETAIKPGECPSAAVLRAAVLLPGHTRRQADRQTGRQADRQTGRQADTALDVLLTGIHADTVLDGREFTA